jgi:hypothetical protein
MFGATRKGTRTASITMNGPTTVNPRPCMAAASSQDYRPERRPGPKHPLGTTPETTTISAGVVANKTVRGLSEGPSVVLSEADYSDRGIVSTSPGTMADVGETLAYNCDRMGVTFTSLRDASCLDQVQMLDTATGQPVRPPGDSI